MIMCLSYKSLHSSKHGASLVQIELLNPCQDPEVHLIHFSSQPNSEQTGRFNLMKLSFHGKVLTLILSLCVVSMIFFSFIPIFQNSKTNRLGKETFLKAAAESVIDKIDRNLFERYGDVQAFSVSEPARAMDTKRLTDFINDMMSAYAPIYRLMLVANPQGKVIAINTTDQGGKPIDTSSFIGTDVSSQPWFRASINNEVSAGNAYVEDVYKDPSLASLTGAKGRFMNFSSPIRTADGKIIGVWSNRMDFDDVVRQILIEETSKLKSERIPHVFLSILNKNGLFLDYPEQDKSLSLSMTNFTTASSASQTQITLVENKVLDYSGDLLQAVSPSKGFSSYKGIGWYASAQIPAYDSSLGLILMLLGTGVGILFFATLISLLVLNPVKNTINTIIKNLNESASALATSGEQMNSSSSMLSSGAITAASSLEETAATIEQLSGKVKLNAGNAKEAENMAKSSKEDAERGNSDIQHLTDAILAIAKSSKQIEDIINVIDDIAFQTNLLALNAAVEAARAGEQGRGFAVVAEAVRNLAQRSSTSAKEISDLIKESVSKIHNGTQMVEKSKSALNKILNSVNKVSSLNSEISLASEEQSEGIQQLSKAVNQLDQTTQSNAAASEQTAASATQLSQLSSRLYTEVEKLTAVITGTETRSPLGAKASILPIKKILGPTATSSEKAA